ncbi:MAG: ISL3 family transposase [Candidatus Acidiferrales bacterium]
MVARHVARWRDSAVAVPAARPQKITPNHAAILITKPLSQLTVEQQELLEQLSAQCPALVTLRKLSAEFRKVFLSSEKQALRAWTINARHSGIGPLARLAVGLEKDLAAVCSAVETCWSNGQVEGQVNCLKTLKRQMYGRAGFALLRSRVLPYVPLPFGTLSQPPRV